MLLSVPIIYDICTIFAKQKHPDFSYSINLIAHITQYNNTDWVLFFFKNYFKHGFWIIFLLLLLFFFTIILSEKTRPFKNICQFYTKQFQDLCWTKSSTEMLQNFSCENTFLYDLNFELLQGHINLLNEKKIGFSYSKNMAYFE